MIIDGVVQEIQNTVSTAITVVKEAVSAPRHLKIISFNDLKERCQQPIDSFRKYGQVVDTEDGIYIYQNNDANILAVAHLDVVKHIEDNKTFFQSGEKIYAPQLDDRLGVYLLLDVLPTFGLKYDLLLTVGEEVGKSTAAYFKPPEGKKYNWIFEIDRAGTDVVCYRYETPEYRKMLEDFGFRVGRGSYTDICYLEFLRVFGINFGCAYYGQHSTNCHVNTEQLEEKLLPIMIRFIKDNENIQMNHDPKPVTQPVYSYGNHRSYNSSSNVHNSGTGQEYVPDTSWKYYPTKKRYRYNEESQYVCTDCGALFRDCYGRECRNIVSICKICKNSKCRGYIQCSICEFSYHNSRYVAEFSVCLSCLAGVAGVDYRLLMNVIDHNRDISNEAIGKILDFIGGK